MELYNLVQKNPCFGAGWHNKYPYAEDYISQFFGVSQPPIRAPAMNSNVFLVKVWCRIARGIGHAMCNSWMPWVNIEFGRHDQVCKLGIDHTAQPYMRVCYGRRAHLWTRLVIRTKIIHHWTEQTTKNLRSPHCPGVSVETVCLLLGPMAQSQCAEWSGICDTETREIGPEVFSDLGLVSFFPNFFFPPSTESPTDMRWKSVLVYVKEMPVNQSFAEWC